MKLFLALLSALVVSAQEHRATVNLNDPKGVTNVHGTVTLVQDGEGDVLVTGTVRGLTPGKHGFHVHQYGDISGGCADAGGHFNPFNKNHGGPRDTERHVGDLGNIEAGQDGVSTFSITDSVIRLTGDNSIVGKSIVVHSGEDDLGRGGFADSLTTGHAGSRLACGVIVQ